MKMYCRSRELLYKLSNLMSLCMESNRLRPICQGRYLKTPLTSLFLCCSHIVKLHTNASGACVIQEYKTVLSESKKICIDVLCDLKVRPIDSQSEFNNNVVVRVSCPDTYNFCVDFIETEDLLKVVGRTSSFISPKKINAISLEIGIPLNHDLSVINEEGNVCISNLISNNMSIQVKHGSINCKNLRCGTMLFDCFDGNITCEGVLQGNTDIRIRKCGCVNGFNFQGGYLRIETENGDIFVSSTYCDKSTFLASKGNLFLKNLHRRNLIFVHKGSLTISGLDGSLNAKVNEGNIKVQVTQLNEDSYLETKKGNIILSVSKEDLCLLNLSGKNITIKDNLESVGEMKDSGNYKFFRSFSNRNLTRSTMKVVCNDGEVHLEKKSWVSSLVFGAK